MRLLSFDTSTSDLHVCLSENGQITVARTINSNLADRQYAASRLLPTIEDLLSEVAWQKSDLKAIVVGIGPGSFTGVRTAVVTARTIAQALKLPLMGISILECYAYQYGASTTVILNGGRKQLFIATYEVVPMQALSADLSASGLRQARVACMVPPSCVNQEAIFEMLKDDGHCLVETSCLASLQGVKACLKPLPDLNNIAIVQSELAFNRVSLMNIAHLTEDEFNQEYFLKAFPYEHVRPLYLRSASVTLKKTIDSPCSPNVSRPSSD